MGEELGPVTLFYKSEDGEYHEIKDLECVEVNAEYPSDPDASNAPDEVYAQWIPNPKDLSFTIEATISKSGYFWLILGNKRLVRRALRWYEWLRRMEVKGKLSIGSKLDLAAQCARYKGNNGKRSKQPHIYQYSFRMERED